MLSRLYSPGSARWIIKAGKEPKQRFARQQPIALMRTVIAIGRTPCEAYQSDEEVLAHIRATASSMSHPVGNCRLGADFDSVADVRLRLRGIQGLRIAGASVMPDLPSGNTNTAAMMIGDKAAAMIQEDWQKGKPLTACPGFVAITHRCSSYNPTSVACSLWCLQRRCLI